MCDYVCRAILRAFVMMKAQAYMLSPAQATGMMPSRAVVFSLLEGVV